MSVNNEYNINDIFIPQIEDENFEEYSELPPLVDEVEEKVSTDIISDIKSGIYNLFVQLINQNIPNYGPVLSSHLAVSYLQEIIDNVNHALEKE
jgi:hypothetical protein